jgi:DNA-binding transcriptional ArsR family regulator
MDMRIQKPRLNEVEINKQKHRHLLYFDRPCFITLDELIKNNIDVISTDEIVGDRRPFQKLVEGGYLFYDSREFTYTVTDYGQEMHKNVSSEMFSANLPCSQSSCVDLIVERRKRLEESTSTPTRRRSNWDKARVVTTRKRVLGVITSRWKCVSEISHMADVSYPTTQKYIKIFEKEGLVELDRPNPRMTLVRLANLSEGASEVSL